MQTNRFRNWCKELPDMRLVAEEMKKPTAKSKNDCNDIDWTCILN